MKRIKILLSIIYIFANTFSLQAQLPKLLPYYKDGKWGYCDSLKNIVIPCEYDSVNFFQNGFAVVGNCANQLCLSGVVDTKGKLICPIQYDKIEDFNEFGVAKAYRGGNLGIIDKSGKEIVPCIYTFVSAWDRNLTQISLDGKFGLINHKGVVSLPAQYDYIALERLNGWSSTYKIPIIKFKLNEKYGFADSIGTILQHTQYDYITLESNHYVIVKNGDKFALYDKTNGKEIFPCKYDNISIIGDKEGQSTYFLLMINNYWGVADGKGKMILPLEYDNINILGDIFQVRKEGEKFLYNSRGKKLPIEKHEVVEQLNPYSKFLKVRVNGKWGMLDSIGNEIIPYQYDNFKFQQNVSAIIAVKDGKYGLFTKQGIEIAPCVYDPIGESYTYNNPSALTVQRNKKSGLFNIEMRKEVIPCEYSFVGKFMDSYVSDLFWVRSDHTLFVDLKTGLFDKTGKMILPCEYEGISHTSNSDIVEIRAKDGSIGFYNIKSGKWVIPTGKYQGRLGIGVNPFALKKDGKFGFVDSTGRKELTEFKYDNIGDIVCSSCALGHVNPFVKISINSRYGIMNRQGEEIIPCEYDSEIVNRDSLFLVKKDNKWGVINHKGKILQDCIYSEKEKESGLIKNRWIIIKEDGRFGAVNANGETIVEPIYRKITGNWQTTMMSIQCEDGKWGVVDSIGNVIIPCLYHEIRALKNGIIAVRQNGFWGVRDLQNSEILSCEYNNLEIGRLNLNNDERDYHIRGENDNFIIANKDGMWGLFDKNGRALVPIKYSNIIILSDNLYLARGNDDSNEFYNSKGERIASLSGDRKRDYYRWDRKYSSLIKTDNGYIDLKGNTYFE